MKDAPLCKKMKIPSLPFSQTWMVWELDCVLFCGPISEHGRKLLSTVAFCRVLDQMLKMPSQFVTFQVELETGLLRSCNNETSGTSGCLITSYNATFSSGRETQCRLISSRVGHPDLFPKGIAVSGYIQKYFHFHFHIFQYVHIRIYSAVQGMQNAPSLNFF